MCQISKLPGIHRVRQALKIRVEITLLKEGLSKTNPGFCMKPVFVFFSALRITFDVSGSKKVNLPLYLPPDLLRVYAINCFCISVEIEHTFIAISFKIKCPDMRSFALNRIVALHLHSMYSPMLRAVA